MGYLMNLLPAILFVGGVIVWTYVKEYRARRAQDDVDRARKDISTLLAILEDYRSHYGRYPILNPESDEQPGWALYGVLTAPKMPATYGAVPPDPLVAEHNPDQITFTRQFIGRRTVNEQIVDPWDSPYNIYIDTDGDGFVEIDLKSQASEQGPIIERRHIRIGAPIAVWSNGPDRRNDFGAGDDITSW